MEMEIPVISFFDTQKLIINGTNLIKPPGYLDVDDGDSVVDQQFLHVVRWKLNKILKVI